MTIQTDEKFILRCIALAQKGKGYVAPNPMVGAILVYNDKIIGEGWHQEFGGDHAEVNCIRNVKKEDINLIDKSTLYVNLEPCAHYGKTPPCADLIIDNKIPRVVIGCKDSFSKVSGKGVEKLNHARVDVILGVLEKECRELNKRFFSFHEKNRPYIIMKWAQSSNGFFAPADHTKKMLSNEYSQILVHKLRSEEAAILVGYNTALIDNPSLTNRLWGEVSPIRIVLDFELKLPRTLTIFDQKNRTVVINFYEEKNVGNISYKKINRHNILPEILKVLYEEQILSVLIEGGSKTLQQFINAGLWDEAIVVSANSVLQQGIAAPNLKDASLETKFYLSDDLISIFKNSSLKEK